MASELRVNTLKDASGNNSIGMSYVAEGSAKAWVNYNGTGTLAVRNSFNVSGVTDVATSEYSTAFTNNMTDGDYAITANGTHDAGSYVCWGLVDLDAGITSSGYTENYPNQNASLSFDTAFNTEVIHGDLA